jgi:D-galactarolactone cycloisomerase
MKISRIDVFWLNAPIKTPFHWSTGTSKYRHTTLLRIETIDGAVGWGETINPVVFNLFDRNTLCFVENAARKSRLPLEKLYAYFIERGVSTRVASSAVGVLDAALWDAYAREAGKPLAEMLTTAPTQSISVYASGLYYGLKDPEIEAGEYIAEGFTCVKMKIGRVSIARDITRIAAVRQAIGQGTLMADANSAYDESGAIEVTHALKDANVLWLEEPFPVTNIDAYRRLHAHHMVPLAVGEALDAASFDAFLNPPAISWVQPNVTAVGGVSKALLVLRRAIAQGLHPVIHSWGTPVMMGISLQVAAAVSEAVRVEVDRTPNPLRTIAPDPVEVLAGGTLETPKRWGTGVEVDDKMVERYCSKKVVYKIASHRISKKSFSAMFSQIDSSSDIQLASH